MNVTVMDSNKKILQKGVKHQHLYYKTCAQKPYRVDYVSSKQLWMRLYYCKAHIIYNLTVNNKT